MMTNSATPNTAASDATGNELLSISEEWLGSNLAVDVLIIMGPTVDRV